MSVCDAASQTPHRRPSGDTPAHRREHLGPQPCRASLPVSVSQALCLLLLLTRCLRVSQNCVLQSGHGPRASRREAYEVCRNFLQVYSSRLLPCCTFPATLCGDLRELTWKLLRSLCLSRRAHRARDSML